MFEISDKRGENVYQYINSKNNKKSSTYPVRDEKEILQTEDIDVAETHNAYLGKELKQENPVNTEWFTHSHYEYHEHGMRGKGRVTEFIKPFIHPKSKVSESDSLTSVHISSDAVQRAIKNSNRNAAPGPNGLPMSVHGSMQNPQ